MIYLTDINRLLSVWIERMGDMRFPSAYREAVSDCVYELNSLVSSTIEEELKVIQNEQKQSEGE